MLNLNKTYFLNYYLTKFNVFIDISEYKITAIIKRKGYRIFKYTLYEAGSGIAL